MNAPDDAETRALLDLFFDHLCAQPVTAFLDADRLLAALDAVTEPERAVRWQERYLRPMRVRWIETAAKSEVLLGAWLPDDVTARLRELLGKPAPLPRKWIDEFVANERVRDAVRTMMFDALTNFVQKASATLQDVGRDKDKDKSAGGLRGALGWGARAAGSVAGSVLGNIGEEIQSRLQDRVRDFVDGAVAGIQTKIADRLKSEETAKAIGKRRVKAFEKFLATTESEASRQALKTPWTEIDAMVPKVIAHNMARDAVRAAVRTEVAEAMKSLANETVGSWLDDAGLREIARAALHQHLGPVVRSFAATEGFAAWRAGVTTPATGANDAAS